MPIFHIGKKLPFCPICASNKPEVRHERWNAREGLFLPCGNPWHDAADPLHNINITAADLIFLHQCRVKL